VCDGDGDGDADDDFYVATSHLPYKMATATTVDRMTPLSGCCKGVKWSAGHGEGKHGAASMALRQASDVG